MVSGPHPDPYLGFNFSVEVEGVIIGGFTEVTGLEIETEVHDYREGGVNEYIHKFAGPKRYPSNLVLRHGITDSDALWSWYGGMTPGTIQRQNGSIILLDSTSQEKLRWNFFGAYPVKWTGPQLRGDRAEVAIESLELAHRGISRA
jgi:phage tail-like protein